MGLSRQYGGGQRVPPTGAHKPLNKGTPTPPRDSANKTVARISSKQGYSRHKGSGARHPRGGRGKYNRG
jgi:hypothetical protein